jgi:hypothetical protein
MRVGILLVETGAASRVLDSTAAINNENYRQA